MATSCIVVFAQLQSHLPQCNNNIIFLVGEMLLVLCSLTYAIPPVSSSLPAPTPCSRPLLYHVCCPLHSPQPAHSCPYWSLPAQSVAADPAPCAPSCPASQPPPLPLSTPLSHSHESRVPVPASCTQTDLTFVEIL